MTITKKLKCWTGTIQLIGKAKVYGKRIGLYAVLSAEVAKSRSCKAQAVVNSKTGEPINGRCRIHGGLSTGAKTQEGKDKSRAAARRGMLAYWARKREFSP